MPFYIEIIYIYISRVQRKVTAECVFKIMKHAAAFEIMKGRLKSNIMAECAFEIMKLVVQRKVTAECAFEIMKRKVTAECAYKIIKNDVLSNITAECEFDIMKRVLQSKLIEECASKSSTEMIIADFEMIIAEYFETHPPRFISHWHLGASERSAS